MEHWEILFGRSGGKPTDDEASEQWASDDWAQEEQPPATVTPSRVTPPTAADVESRALDALGEFRTMLGTRLEADELLSSAIEVRQRALAEADEIVHHAETVAREIETQARADADRMVAEAALVLEQARAEATAHRSHYLAEVDAQAGRTILRLESLADDLDLALERAKDDLVETLIPLTELRNAMPFDPADLADQPDPREQTQPERRRNRFRSSH